MTDETPSRSYVITAYDHLDERWHTATTHDIDDAGHAAEQLAERLSWADVWRAHADLVVHYGRVHARQRGRRRDDEFDEAVSVAASRWYAAVATRNLGLADAAWYVYSRVVQGAEAGRGNREAA